MSKDISRILQNWDLSAGQKAVRRILGDDGREKIQRRIDLGILQLEVDGRPDGLRPKGFLSSYDYYKHEAEEAEKHSLPGDPFKLSSSACEQLQIEALLYYQRRLCFFELQDYTGAARDARRNLEVFTFVRKYAEREEDKLAMDQYRAFVIFHRTKAEVLGCLDRKEYDFALKHIEAGDREIRSFFAEYDRSDLCETSEELKQMAKWKEQIDRMRPVSRQERLRQQLKEAIEREEYERAAQLRDEIAKQPEHDVDQ